MAAALIVGIVAVLLIGLCVYWMWTQQNEIWEKSQALIKERKNHDDLHVDYRIQQDQLVQQIEVSLDTMRQVIDLDTDNMELTHALKTERQNHGQTTAALLTLEQEHAHLLHMNAVLWERSTILYEEQQKELKAAVLIAHRKGTKR